MKRLKLVQDRTGKTQVVEADLAGLPAEVKDGSCCPTCGQFCKLYARQVTSTMARALIIIYKHFKRCPEVKYVHVPDLVSPILGSKAAGGDAAKLRYWGLIERVPGVRDDGSKRTGNYRITDFGVAFVEKRVTITKIARTFNQQTFYFEGPQISIIDALEAKFNYSELMTE